jgi:Double zinc ribbon
MSPSRDLLVPPFGDVAGFFDSQTWIVARNVGLFFLAVFWLSIGYWVYKDARRRIDDPWLVAMAILLGLIPPFIGALIYMLFRPPEYLDEVHERELEIRAMERRLSAQDLRCPVCRAEIDAGYVVCPVCTTRLKQACVGCKAPLEPQWLVCPYCETPVPRGGPVELPSVVDESEAPPRRRTRGGE